MRALKDLMSPQTLMQSGSLQDCFMLAQPGRMTRSCIACNLLSLGFANNAHMVGLVTCISRPRAAACFCSFV